MGEDVFQNLKLESWKLYYVNIEVVQKDASQVAEMFNGNGLLVKPKPIKLTTSCPSMFDSTSNVTNVMACEFCSKWYH